jgi:hypothetical protein
VVLPTVLAEACYLIDKFLGATAGGQPLAASVMMGVTAVGQRIEHVRIDNDHKPSRLPSKAVGEQRIGTLGDVTTPAITDSDKARQPAPGRLAWQFVR